MKRTHQLLVCGDDIHLRGENINTESKNKQAQLDASKKVGLQINSYKT
jgi:hypothetical protein